MAYELRTTRDEVLARFPLEIWPLVDKSAMAEAEEKTASKTDGMFSQYCAREASVLAYLRREPLRSIKEKHGFSRHYVQHLVLKCIATHPDGRIWGFRALVPYVRQKQYDRIAPVKPGAGQGGHAGALQQLFERYAAVCWVRQPGRSQLPRNPWLN